MTRLTMLRIFHKSVLQVLDMGKRLHLIRVDLMPVGTAKKIAEQLIKEEEEKNE